MQNSVAKISGQQDSMATSETAPWNPLSPKSLKPCFTPEWAQDGCPAHVGRGEDNAGTHLLGSFSRTPTKEDKDAGQPPAAPQEPCILNLTRRLGSLQLSLPGNLHNTQKKKTTSPSQHGGSTLLSQVQGDQT